MLYYFRIAHGNFGDALNPWLWPRLAPEACDKNDPTLFLGIGTIMSPRVPAEPIKVVFGSGCGEKTGPQVDAKWFFYGVRGPRTAARVGLPPDMVLSDPAILIRRVALPPQQKRHKLSFMPHHQSTFEADWASLCAEAGLHFIDPRGSVEQVLAEILQTELLLTEAMHGAIVADALRVPWIPVRLYGHFVEFKWRDWAESLSLNPDIHVVPPIYQRALISKDGLKQAFKKTASVIGVGKPKWRTYRIQASSKRQIAQTFQKLTTLAREMPPLLSSDSAIQRADDRLFETLGRLRQDWKDGKFKHPAV